MSLHYLAESFNHQLYFTDRLKEKINHIAHALGDGKNLFILPDATLKSNTMPTGFAAVTSPADTLLMPFVLSDPGCGYLLFKLEKTSALSDSWRTDLGFLLDKFVKQQLAELLVISNDEKHYLDDLSARANLTNEEHAELFSDFLSVSNTIEIRQPYTVENPYHLNHDMNMADHLIGFVHAGTESFANILASRYVYRIAEYATKHKLASPEDITRGIFGVPLNTPLGSEYAKDLLFAMEYASYNREKIFERLKQLIETNFPLHISYINNKPHAGFFTDVSNETQQHYISRGVQALTSTINPLHDLTLLAGERETIAALVLPAKNVNNQFFPHGISNNVLVDFDYASHFSRYSIDTYQNFARDTYYNTQPNFDTTVSHSHNLLQTLNFYKNRSFIQSIEYLAPLINIHGKKLLTQNEAI